MENNEGLVLLVRRLTILLTRVGEFWLNRSYVQQITLILLVLLAKNAFDIELRNIQDAYLPGAQEFPRAVGYFSASFGQVVIAYGLGVTTTTQWVVLHLFLIAIALGVAFYLVGTADPGNRSLMLLVVASATATSSLLTSVGKYDVLTYLGAVILALAKTLPGSVVGSAIMASGNPEQAMVASAALLLLTFAPEFRAARARAVGALVLIAFSWLGVQAWFASSALTVGRLNLIPRYLAESIANFVVYPGTSLWSWLNAGWLLVLAAIVLVAKTSRKWLALALVVVPGVAALITADGPRVFGLVGLPAFLVATTWLIGRTSARTPSSIWAGVLVVGIVVFPTYVPGTGWAYALVLGNLVSLFP